MVPAAGLIHSPSTVQSFLDMQDCVTKSQSANFDILLSYSWNFHSFWFVDLCQTVTNKIYVNKFCVPRMQNKKKLQQKSSHKKQRIHSFRLFIFFFFSILSYKQANIHETKFFFMWIYCSRAWKVVFSQKCIHKSKYMLNYGFQL